MSPIAIAAISLALFAAPAAFASEEPMEAYDFKLDLSDADTAAGAARVYADIRRQAVRVCGGVRSGGLSRKVRDCREDVRANAVAAANKPLVTVLWRSEAVLLAER